MKEYRVVASTYNDLCTPDALRRPFIKEFGQVSSIHVIKCKSLDEIPDLFIDVCGSECDQMKNRIYWYVDEGNDWSLTEL